MEFAARIRDRIMDATFDEKRRIMDIIEVQVVIHYDDQGKWLEVTCAIPAYNDAIELLPSARREHNYRGRIVFSANLIVV